MEAMLDVVKESLLTVWTALELIAPHPQCGKTVIKNNSNSAYMAYAAAPRCRREDRGRLDPRRWSLGY